MNFVCSPETGDSLIEGQRANCKFRFLYYPEYLWVGMTVLLREGKLCAIGKITDLIISSNRHRVDEPYGAVSSLIELI